MVFSKLRCAIAPVGIVDLSLRRLIVCALNRNKFFESRIADVAKATTPLDATASNARNGIGFILIRAFPSCSHS